MRTKNTSNWSRRALLQSLAVGAGAVSLPGLASLNAPPAFAQSGAPRRFVVLFHPNGLHENTGWGSWLAPGATETDFQYQGMTTPLERHRADTVFFDNLILASGTSYGDKHHMGRCLVLTGANIDDGERPRGPSIDQYVAEKLGRMVTPEWPSLELVSQEDDTYVSFSADGTCTPAIQSPWTAYERVFANFMSGTQAAEPDPNVLVRIKLRQSVLDSVAKDLQTFQRRLPAEDRARAEAQLASIRTLESRLAGGAVAGPVASCSRPALAAEFDADDTRRFPELIRMYSDLIVSTLACDRTRVILMNYRGGKNRLPCDFDPINSPEEEHSLSHDFEEKFVDFRKLLFEETAYIADQLKNIPEDGGSMLDHTIILCTTEISQGHQHGRMPWLTIGGKGLGVQTGRCLKLSKEVASDANDYSGYPHQKLFVSIMNALGMSAETGFGLPEYGSGPMSGYLV